jgi:hypothetical protein
MQIALLSTSKKVPLALLSKIAYATTKQLKEFCADWDLAASSVIPWDASDRASAPPTRIWIVDSAADLQNALGAHWIDPDTGLPTGKVLVDVILANGGTLTDGPVSVSAIASHEILELRADPSANINVAMPDGRMVAYESADPVEDGGYPVILHDRSLVWVSNYVLPDWFNVGSKTRRFDKMGLLKAPFTMTDGGYMIIDNQPVFGFGVPEWKKEAKLTPFSRTGRRLVTA